MRFTEKLARMMYGRYGNDNFNRFILVMACILAVVNVFEPNIVMSLLPTVLIFWCTFRMFSRNIAARRRENSRYLKIIGPIKNKIKLLKNKFKDRKTHVYKKCPKCKAVLRLPKRKGEHTVACPKCGERFNVKI